MILRCETQFGFHWYAGLPGGLVFFWGGGGESPPRKLASPPPPKYYPVYVDNDLQHSAPPKCTRFPPKGENLQEALVCYTKVTQFEFVKL